MAKDVLNPQSLILASCALDVIAMAVCIPIKAVYLSEFGLSDAQQGMMASTNALCSVATAPLLGRLSDSSGRVSILQAGAVVSAIGYVLCASADSWVLVVMAIVLPGLCKCQMPTSMAYLSDISDEESRSINAGLIGATFSFAFMVGPALGGVLTSHFGTKAPLMAAGGISFVNFLILIGLSEPIRSQSQERGGSTVKHSSWSVFWHPTENSNEVDTDNEAKAVVRQMLGAKLAFSLGKAGYESLFALHARRVFQASGAEIAWLLTIVGTVGMGTNLAGHRFKGRLREKLQKTHSTSTSNEDTGSPLSDKHVGWTSIKLIIAAVVHAAALLEWGLAPSWPRYVGAVCLISISSNLFMTLSNTALSTQVRFNRFQSIKMSFSYWKPCEHCC